MLTYRPQTISIIPFSEWDSIEQPLSFSQDEKLNLVYDRNGNLVTGDGFFREYNEFNQLVRIRNGTTVSGMLLEDYTYHPTQERVLIKHVYNNSGGLKETIFYISDEFVRVQNASGTYDTIYVRVDGQLVAQKNPDGSKYFIHNDHLGSSSVITDASGNPIENTSYSPFGEILSGGSKSRYSYTGQEYDSVIGDFDFDARRYKATWGQYIKPDFILPDAYNSQALNRYSYVNNNPFKFVDPLGKDAIITIDDSNNKIAITAKVYIYGDLAENAEQEFQDSINNAWNGLTYDSDGGKTYDVDVSVDVETVDQPMSVDKLGPGENFVRVTTSGNSNVVFGGEGGGRTGAWNAFATEDAAHEFGHLVGLDDKRVKLGIYANDKKLGDIEFPMDKSKWKGNIMGMPGGKAERRNLKSFIDPSFKKHQQIRTNPLRNAWNSIKNRLLGRSPESTQQTIEPRNTKDLK